MEQGNLVSHTFQNMIQKDSTQLEFNYDIAVMSIAQINSKKDENGLTKYNYRSQSQYTGKYGYGSMVMEV